MVLNIPMTSTTKSTTTHEHFIQGVRDIVLADAVANERITPEQAERLGHGNAVLHTMRGETGGRAGALRLL